ncbi:hypothetical protein CCP4SC76_1390003 [Gammaproteobacteria bacterium]
MFTIKHTEEFNTWLAGLKDGLVHSRLARRLDRASFGIMGENRLAKACLNCGNISALAGACTTHSAARC